MTDDRVLGLWRVALSDNCQWYICFYTVLWSHKVRLELQQLFIHEDTREGTEGGRDEIEGEEGRTVEREESAARLDQTGWEMKENKS